MSEFYVNWAKWKFKVVFTRSCCHGNFENVKFYQSIKIYHQYIFHMPSFSLWAATFFLSWLANDIRTNCLNCVRPPWVRLYPTKWAQGIYRCLIWLYSCDTHHVPNVVGQPIDNRIDTADKLQMLGFGGSLSYKEHDKTRRYKRHGYDDKDCNHKICPLTPETCTTITWKSTINFSFVSQFRTTHTSPNCSKAG